MRKTLNVKFLAILVGSTLLFAVGVHFLHAFQVERNVSGLLRQTDRAEESGQPQQVVKYLHRYLVKVPTDTEALARYGRTLEQLADSGPSRLQAFMVLEQVLRRDPGRHDLRRLLVRLAMHDQVRRYSDARGHLEILLRDTASNDGELEQQLGRCLAANGEFPRAAELLTRSIQHAPERLESSIFLAFLLRTRLDKAQQADQVMDQMVAKNAQSFQAYLARGRYWKELAAQDPAAREARLKREAEDFNRARELAPDDADVLLAVAALAQDESRPDEARIILELGLQLHPQNVFLYRALSDLEIRAGKHTEAVACLRRGLQAVPDDADLLWALANALLQEGKDPAAEVAQLRKKNLPRARFDFLQAQALINQGEWLKAIPLLERCHTELAGWPDISRQTDLLLGRCQQQVGNVDQQYAAYRRAVTANPGSLAANLGLAGTLLALGQRADALDTYRRLMPYVPAARLDVARLLILRNLGLPPAKRQWKEVDQVLDEAAKALPESVEVPILRAEVLAARNLTKSAQEMLEEARAANPKSVELRIALASLAERRGKPEQALAILDEAKRELGDRLELRLAGSRVWARRGGDEAAKALQQLGQNLEKFRSAEQRVLLTHLAEAQAWLGNRKEAERLWNQVAAQNPLDLGIKLTLFDVARQAGHEADMERLRKEMEKIEGPDGALTRYARTAQLLIRARKGDSEALEQARGLITQIAAQRPAWARVSLCEAEIHELRRDTAGAVKCYQRAIDLGEHSPAVIRRTVQLLYQQRRYTEADEVLKKLPEEAPLSPDLQRVAAQLSVRQQDYSKALKLAHQAVSAQSTDYRDYIWLGQLLRATPQSAQAEAALRRAVALADKEPDTWVALIQYLAHQGQKDKAEAAIQEAQRKLPPAKAPLALAQCYEAIGRTDQAHKQYSEALAAQPGDVAVRRSAANFYLRTGQAAEAEPHLRKLIALRDQAPKDAAWAQRVLAIVLASSGTYQQSRDALALMNLVDEEDNKAVPAGSMDDQRARALVLATQKGRRQRRKAIDVLEKVMTQQPPTADDQFLLAQLYVSVGNWPKARERLSSLLATHGDKPLYVSYYAQTLLRRGDLAEAQVWVDKLRGLPDAANTLPALELQARLLAAQKKPAEVIALVQAALARKEVRLVSPDALDPWAVSLLDELSQAHPTEKSYATTSEKLARDCVARQPEKVLLLIHCLGKQGRVAEVLDLCADAWKTCPPEAVGNACMAALHAAPPPAAQVERVERWLETARRKHPNSAQLLVCQADLRDLQGRYAEAIDLYRQALKKDSDHVMALNNLAYLLILKDRNSSAATDLLKHALAVAGPLPELLDTRALIHLTRGQAEAARKDLEEGLAEAPRGALFFHLAQAHHFAKNRSAAVLALQKANKVGLQAVQLHALERTAYQQLSAELLSR